MDARRVEAGTGALGFHRYPALHRSAQTGSLEDTEGDGGAGGAVFSHPHSLQLPPEFIPPRKHFAKKKLEELSFLHGQWAGRHDPLPIMLIEPHGCSSHGDRPPHFVH